MSAAASTVLVVDDHPIVVDGIRYLLQSEPDFAIVGSAANRSEALAAVERLQPDLVVLDLRLDGDFDPLLSRSIMRLAPRTHIVVHTAYGDPEPLRASISGGVYAVVPKDSSALIPALRSALGGERTTETEYALSFRTPAFRHDGKAGTYESLTPREYEILCVISQGRTSAQIARELHLATNTVRSYTQTLLRKLHAHNRIEAVATARRLRIL